MPDLLAHYAVSYLVASRVLKPRYALLVALAGLLPDIDALFRVHRWVTHSLVLTALIASIAAVPLFYAGRSLLKHLALAASLYTLHIVLNVFTAPTPILWPLTSSSYMITLGINGVIGGSSTGFNPYIEIIIEPSSFSTQQTLYGPIVSELGIIVAIAITVTLISERLYRRS